LGVTLPGGLAYPERARVHEAWLAETVRRAGCWLATRTRPRRLAPGSVVRRVARAGPALAALDDDALRRQARRAASRMRTAGINARDGAEVLAAIREAASRTLAMHPYEVQILGAWTLVRGRVAEMETGEGKTLTAALAAVTVALTGVPVHVITANEYLAARDAALLEPLYRFFGLSSGLIGQSLRPEQRRAVYARAIVHCSNSELVFDYLRDRIAIGQRRSALALRMARLEDRDAVPVVLNGLHFAIVDEIDSILADEARTPLIISGGGGAAAEDDGYCQALGLARELDADVHYRIATAERGLALTDAGRDRLASRSDGLGPVWRSARRREELVTQALSALHLFHRDRHYVLNGDKVQIVDEYTGRIFPDRAWEQGLHQLIELKEGVPLSARRTSLARISYQQFFRRYLRVCGMSGTVSEIAGELRWVYRLSVCRIPTNRPLRRRFLGSRVCIDEEHKHARVLESVLAHRSAGRPVLLGTRSIGASARLSAFLHRHGIPHQVLNARQDEEEATIIARAGESGRVTVATNMAGRGTDILLDDAARAAGGLHVIATERHESARIDRQLYGRAGRQGDAGSGEAILSLDDELWQVFTPRVLRMPATLALRHAGAAGRRLVGVTFDLAQWRAERAHGRARRALLRSDRHLDDALAFAGARE
jgi:preprotein translocase subunit SecA